MSGNGIRCFAQAVAMRSGSLEVQRVLTDAGLREVTLYATADPTVVNAAVDMGEVADLSEPANWAALACAPGRPVAHLSLGNPHSVVGVEDVAVVDLKSLGEKVPHVNLEIIEPGPETNGVTMRVHERGAGITLACGTGACAVADAAYAWGLVPRSCDEVIVHMDGGDARVRVSADRRATLIGPTNHLSDHTVTA